MFDRRFPEHWTTNRKLIWLIGAVAQGASAIWKTVTGTLIHITDALASPMQKCEVTLEPIQDLHGQDAPYPAGGGVNKFNVGSIVPYNSNATVTKDGGSFTVTNNNSYVAAMFCDSAGHIMQFPVSDGKYTISIGEATTVAIGVYGSTDGETFSWLSNGITSGNTSAVFTVNGQNFVEFRASAPANGSATIKNFQFESGNSATPYSPYSNICPITGWTGCEVTRTGKNVFQSPYDVQKPSGYNGSWEGVSVVDGWVVQTGNPIGAGGHGGAIAHNIKAGVYTLSFKCDYSELVGTTTMAYNVWAEYADGTKATIVSPQYSITATVVKKTITLEKDVKDLALRATSGGSNTSSVFKYTDIQLELGSTATAYEPYSGTTLSVAFPDGLINQWDEEWELGGIAGNTGQPYGATDRIRSINYSLCKPNTSYYGYIGASGVSLIGWFYDSTKAFINGVDFTNKVVTSPQNAAYFKLSTYGGNYTSYLNDISINYPSSVTTYEPYTNTVYGGSHEFVSGGLTPKKVLLTLNGNSTDGNYSRISSGRFNIDNLPINYLRNESAADSGESSQYKSLPQTSTNGQFDTLAANYSAAFNVSLNLSRNTLRIKDTRFDTVAELQAAYAIEKPQFALTLATPTEISLTPQPISTLKGENNVWGDGDIELTYKAQSS